MKVSNLYITQIKQKCGIIEKELQSAEIGKFQTAEMLARERKGDKGGVGVFSYDLLYEQIKRSEKLL